MEPIDLSNIYNMYTVVDDPREGVHNHLVGRMVVTPTRQLVLSDYNGSLDGLGGVADDAHRRRFEAWRDGSHSRAISLGDIRAGRHPELLQEARLPAPPEAPEGPVESWFRVDRHDLEQPLFVNFRDGKAYMGGTPLSSAEAHSLLEDGRQGRARIRHHNPDADEAVSKAEESFSNLAKLEPHLQAALSALGAAVKAGHIDPEVEKSLHREIFYDPMVEGVKNKKSFHDEINKPRPAGGVHVMLDGNDFGSINKIHSHAVGDQAIKAMGGAIRSSMDEVAGPEHQDLWRFGGDEFAAWLPSHEHAGRFLRTLRSKLDAIPAIGGTHNLSMSAGVGATHNDADQALNTHAKAAKKAAGYLPGSAKMHVHSLVPGHEGQVPVDVDVPKPPPPAPASPEPKPVAAIVP